MSWMAKIKAAWTLTPEQIQQAAKLKAGENVDAMREQLTRVVNRKGWTRGEIVKAMGGKVLQTPKYYISQQYTLE